VARAVPGRERDVGPSVLAMTITASEGAPWNRDSKSGRQQLLQLRPVLSGLVRVGHNLSIRVDRRRRKWRLVHNSSRTAELLRVSILDQRITVYLECGDTERGIRVHAVSWCRSRIRRFSRRHGCRRSWGVEAWTAYGEDCLVDYWTNEQPGRASVQRPTYVAIIGSPAYTQGPPASLGSFPE
jgi:hypothetical protein